MLFGGFLYVLLFCIIFILQQKLSDSNASKLISSDRNAMFSFFRVAYIITGVSFIPLISEVLFSGLLVGSKLGMGLMTVSLFTIFTLILFMPVVIAVWAYYSILFRGYKKIIVEKR